MATDFKQLILNAIHACADSSGDDYIKLGLGTPGNTFELDNETEETGQAFEPLPTALDCIVTGIAGALDQLNTTQLVDRDQLTNLTGTTVPAGSMVRASGNNQFLLAGSGASVGLLGVTTESIAPGQKGPVAIAGIVDVLMQTGLGAIATPARLYPSITAGRLTTLVTGAPVGIILNASTYVSQQKVRAVLRIPAQ